MTRSVLPLGLILFFALAFNQGASLNASIRAPFNRGIYTLRWDMLQDGVGYFRDKGVSTGDQTIVVK